SSRTPGVGSVSFRRPPPACAVVGVRGVLDKRAGAAYAGRWRRRAGGVAMTESEWLQCSEPYKMLHVVKDIGSDRKLRLFAGACCRQAWERLDDNTCKSSVEMVEKFCEGTITNTEALDVVLRLHSHWAELKGDWPDPAVLV